MYAGVCVEITNICNMHGFFCHGYSREPRQMCPEEFPHIPDQLAGQTQYIDCHRMGEPLTHPELPLFLKTAAQRVFC